MSDSEATKIVGITLVKNEDLFVEQAVRNALAFCDRIVIADHQSTDRTLEIVTRLAEEFPDKIDLRRIRETPESHFLISNYAGSNTWIFGIDGDELYDPVGLTRMRAELLSGHYDDWWLVFGNVLNCVSIDPAKKTATGYLAPPCRSMTKLFNFRLIESWDGAVTHVCANGTIRFKSGYDATRRLNLHEQMAWDQSHYRCLHTCFMRRSSLDEKGATARPNVSENVRGGALGQFRRFLARLAGGVQKSEWKLEKYARGELVTVDASNFLVAA